MMDKELTELCGWLNNFASNLTLTPAEAGKIREAAAMLTPTSDKEREELVGTVRAWATDIELGPMCILDRLDQARVLRDAAAMLSRDGDASLLPGLREALNECEKLRQGIVYEDGFDPGILSRMKYILEKRIRQIEGKVGERLVLATEKGLTPTGQHIADCERDAEKWRAHKCQIETNAAGKAQQLDAASNPSAPLQDPSPAAPDAEYDEATISARNAAELPQAQVNADALERAALWHDEQVVKLRVIDEPDLMRNVGITIRANEHVASAAAIRAMKGRAENER